LASVHSARVAHRRRNVHMHQAAYKKPNTSGHCELNW
jgi:hypothetical protein